jgi:hypothetical protein
MDECEHQLVSAVIDDVPTALALRSQPAGSAYTTPALHIGNNLSVSVWNPNGQVERKSGAQGLPTANITAMLPGSDDTVWSGHTQGLTLYIPSGPPGAGSDAPPERGPWRYFYGDRYLPGERVTAMALPAAAAAKEEEKEEGQSASGPSIWAATEWGLALITAEVTTLSSKAAAMQALLPPLERYGWHSPSTSLHSYGARSVDCPAVICRCST